MFLIKHQGGTAPPILNIYFLQIITIFNRGITWAGHVARRRSTGNVHETRKKLNNFTDFSAVAMLSSSLHSHNGILERQLCQQEQKNKGARVNIGIRKE